MLTAVRASISTPGTAENTDRGLDAQQVIGLESEGERGGGDGQGVAQGDKIAGALGGHDAGQTGDFENVALGEGAVADQFGGGDGHAHPGAGTGLAQGLGLGAGIDHAAGAVFVEVAEFAHDCLSGSTRVMWNKSSLTVRSNSSSPAAFVSPMMTVDVPTMHSSGVRTS